MFHEVKDTQIELEAQAGYKPLAIESGITILPLSELGDREFELLVYSLIKQEIEAGLCPGFERVALMQGVAERGRDCVLYSKTGIVGVVQCKKYAARMSRPQVLKEVLKFILFATLDKSILPDLNNFEYWLYVSNDLTGPAIDLVFSFATELQKDVASGNVNKYVGDLVAEYEAFSCYVGALPIADVLDLLNGIRLSVCNATDLTNRIYKQQAILSTFFRIKTVVALESADVLIRKALDDHGLKLITDNDLRALQARIGNVPIDDRINLGWVDFFGFSKDFFEHLRGEKFKELMTAVTAVQAVLAREQIDFVNSEISRCIQEKITLTLLGTGAIHRFTVGIAAPYLLGRLTPKIVAGSLPKDLLVKFHPQCSLTKDDLVRQVSEVLLESSRLVMRGDYSQIVGDQDLVRFKLKLFEQIHEGLDSAEAAKEVLDRDLPVILPVLDQIEVEIGSKIHSECTVVIKDASFLEDKDQMNRMVKTIRSIDKV